MNIYNILTDPAVHNWVKEQYRAAQRRDCLGAANDADLLAAMLRQRCELILSVGRQREVAKRIAAPAKGGGNE